MVINKQGAATKVAKKITLTKTIKKSPKKVVKVIAKIVKKIAKKQTITKKTKESKSVTKPAQMWDYFAQDEKYKKL